MVEVTKEDRDCRDAIYRELTGFRDREPSHNHDWMDKYIAAHRTTAFAAGVAAERERCAEIADQAMNNSFNPDAMSAAEVIADMIRNAQ